MDALNTLLKALVALVLLGVVLITGSLIRNAPPLLDAPGPLVRLGTYLTTNTVEVRENAARPELRPRLYAASPEATWEAARQAVDELGWRLIHADPETLSVQAVAVTPLLRFQDDIYLRIRPAESGLSTLYFRSRSRIGRSDLAANTRHLREFRERLETILMR